MALALLAGSAATADDGCRLWTRICAKEGFVILGPRADRLVDWRKRTDYYLVPVWWLAELFLDGADAEQPFALLLGRKDLESGRFDELIEEILDRGDTVIVTRPRLRHADHLDAIAGVDGSRWSDAEKPLLYGVRNTRDDHGETHPVTFILSRDGDGPVARCRDCLDANEIAWLLAQIGSPAPGGGVGGGPPAQVPAPPTKQIVIYNNSTDAAPHTIYPVLSIGAKTGAAFDLWMQAQFEPEFPDKNPYPPFHTTLSYRAYINPDVGIPPGGHVTITVPFYTQLQVVTTDNIGVIPDQFVNWWNAARIYFFDGATALEAARITDDPPQHSPTPVTPLNGAAVPTCVSTTGSCAVVLTSYAIDPPSGIPFQLNEYTFASAEGPPLNPRPATIMTEYVNYNVSSLDSVYLPIAMGPLKAENPEPGATRYLGSAQTIPDFSASLSTFVANGSGWPFSFPAYFGDPQQYPNNPVIFGAACSLTPLGNDEPYFLPKVPGTYNLIEESYNNPPPIPPILSSNPPDFADNYTICNPSPPPPFQTPDLGLSGQGMVDLWTRCTTQNDQTSLCKSIRIERDFFLNNYASSCNSAGDPDLTSIMKAVYGWVPIIYNNCAGSALANTTGSPDYTTAISTYCELQYNYLQPGVQTADIFNPYTYFIHGVLQSSAYAFSIDDELAFRHLVASGIILAIGGTNGLEDTEPAPVPNRQTYAEHCRPK